jgi:hypothetical protein
VTACRCGEHTDGCCASPHCITSQVSSRVNTAMPEIRAKFNAAEMETEIQLTPFMNPSPFSVHREPPSAALHTTPSTTYAMGCCVLGMPLYAVPDAPTAV